MARIRVHTREDVPTEAREAIPLAMANQNGCEYCEAFAHIMGNLFNNYFNRYARTEFDFPAAPALPE